MFLANSFKEKLKRSYLEGEIDQDTPSELHQYIPNKKDPRVLFSFKDTYKDDPVLSFSSNFNSQQLKALDKTEWENTFTLKNLHRKWRGHTELNFESNFRKFTDDAAFPQAKPAKEFVKNLRDPDILELKKKDWNQSNNTKEKCKSDLKKTLFELSSGLKDFKIVPIKEQKVYEGVETRDHIKLKGHMHTWNISNLVNKKQFKITDKENLNLAQENSYKYWKDNEENREEEKPFPIDEARKKVEIIRYFQKYRSPYQKSIDFNNTMDKVKEMTFFEKERIEKKIKKNNPGLLLRYPEKINALILKELNDTYKDKYNELTGKLSKEELKERQMKEHKFTWTDKDLSNKITAINKLNSSGILNVKMDVKSSAIRLCRSQKKEKRNILFPLVIKGTEIQREEEKIHEKLQEEYKKQKKLEMLQELKTFKKKKNKLEKFVSKYPIPKDEYDFNKNYKRKTTLDIANEKEDELDKKISYMITCPSAVNSESTNSILNEISKSSECNPHFLEAYTIVAGKELERINTLEKKNKDKIQYVYTHPGAYREFVFIEKVKKEKPKKINDKGKGPNENKQIEIKNEEDEYEDKEIKKNYWSCCMNSDPNSPGCQKKKIRNFKYLYD
jgi:hypothetical protein